MFQHTSHISHIHFHHTFSIHKCHFSMTTRKFQHTFSIYVGNSNKNIFFRRTLPTYYLQTKKRRFRAPYICLTLYLLIPATFCCTHSPILLRKCSSIFIPLMVNCLMKSYASSSFALKLRFSVFSS